MDPCTLSRPRVIDTALLERCIDEQLPPGEAGRLARLDGVAFEDLKQIRLEYLFILRIDHLWVLKNLTKLSLNNNYIEKIENLESLVHLEHLDLSFNKISKIENLDALEKLEKLSFYENFIEVIENMDTLHNLRIFSIGKNEIKDLDNILYFRCFNNLTSLNMAGNPCTEEPNFRYYIAVFLPKISYYEYRKIQPQEIETGRELFSDELRRLEEKEMKIRLQNEQKEKQESDAKLHSKSFVEYLNTRHLFDQMYENDVEGKTFLLMGEELEEYYTEYEEEFLEACRQLFQVGQKHYIIRQAEIDEFMKSFEKTKKDSQDESIRIKDEFNKQRKELIAEIKFLNSKMDPDGPNYDPTYAPDNFIFAIDDYTTKFEIMTHDIWKVLMKLELQLYEQMEEVISTYDRSLGEMINNFLEECQNIFSLIRSLEVTYTENLSDVGNKILTNMNLVEDVPLADELKVFLVDKEVFINAVAATHDIHMQVIDNREDMLVSRSRSWYESLISDLTKDEISRNRLKVLEINHFLDIRREDFDNTLQDLIPKDSPESDEDYVD